MENVTATMHTLATARLSLHSRPAGTTAGIRDTGAATTPVAQHNALAAWPPATAQLPPQPVALAEHHTPVEPHSSEVLPAATEVNDAGELADALAALLDLEADLRGIAR